MFAKNFIIMLMSLLVVGVGSVSHAVFTDDFESYAIDGGAIHGQGSGAGIVWLTTEGSGLAVGDSAVFINTDAYEGSQSLQINGLSTAASSDVMAQLGGGANVTMGVGEQVNIQFAYKSVGSAFNLALRQWFRHIDSESGSFMDTGNTLGTSVADVYVANGGLFQSPSANLQADRWYWFEMMTTKLLDDTVGANQSSAFEFKLKVTDTTTDTVVADLVDSNGFGNGFSSFFRALTFRTSGQSSVHRIDSLSVVVPEPASIALFGIGGLLMLKRYHK